ncbi:MAG: ATP synthase subunit I, partial [Nevskiales bacterium]
MKFHDAVQHGLTSSSLFHYSFAAARREVFGVMKPLRLRGMSLAYGMCSAQLGIGLVAALIGYAFSGKEAAAAAFYGALVAVIPSLYFAGKVLLSGRNDRPLEVLGAVYVGEAGKIVLAALMFI